MKFLCAINLGDYFMNCKNCNVEMSAGQLFCEKCGSKSYMEKLCKGCEQPISSDANFCGFCGTTIKPHFGGGCRGMFLPPESPREEIKNGFTPIEPEVPLDMILPDEKILLQETASENDGKLGTGFEGRLFKGLELGGVGSLTLTTQRIVWKLRKFTKKALFSKHSIALAEDVPIYLRDIIQIARTEVYYGDVDKSISEPAFKITVKSGDSYEFSFGDLSNEPERTDEIHCQSADRFVEYLQRLLVIRNSNEELRI